jgi:superfamily II DNA or RNA helicase
MRSDNSARIPADQRAEILNQIAREEAAIAILQADQAKAVERVTALREKLTSLLLAESEEPHHGMPSNDLGTPISNAAKVTLFRSIFRGREDVFPLRWDNTRTGKSGYAPACTNEWQEGICDKLSPSRRAGIATCGECKSQAFRPVTDDEIARHLRGDQVMGVYPLLPDDTCWFLALDFDGDHWDSDIRSFTITCKNYGLSTAIERSRSGQGAHAWFFFSSPVLASLARSMGCFLLTKTMYQRHEMSLRSYDRLFPNQDTLPKGGFGNLIALPLQRTPRESGNTLFLDHDLATQEDQWRFLAGVERIAPDRVKSIVGEDTGSAHILGLREPGTGGSSPLNLVVLESGGHIPMQVSLPAVVEAELSNRFAIPRAGLPSSMLKDLKQLATFGNPEFYQRQRMRLSTGLTPRVITCFEEMGDLLLLPRGCASGANEVFAANGIALSVHDQRTAGQAIDVSFRGQLTQVQEEAVHRLLEHEYGVLVAPPGVGKTVIGCRLIAERKRSTLVIVHRQELLAQWIVQMELFLGLDRKKIGHIGGGQQKRTGVIDVAMMQSLTHRGEVDSIVGEYGHIIVDECHHCPAFTFERVLSETKAVYLTGLTATPQRRDGRHPIIAMQLGPVRHTVTSKGGCADDTFRRRLVVRETEFRLDNSGTENGIQAIYTSLVTDNARNDLILDDIIAALEDGRSPILLTERREHVNLFADRLKGFARNLIVLHGGMTVKERRQTLSQLAAVSEGEERLLIATGRYVGEGFDDARLDTLFLALPVSWKGTLVQYSGRLHRAHPGKREVMVYDYYDRNVPVLQRMFEKRLRGYRAMGYEQKVGP